MNNEVFNLEVKISSKKIDLKLLKQKVDKLKKEIELLEDELSDLKR